MTPRRRSVVYSPPLLLKLFILMGLGLSSRGCALSCEIAPDGIMKHQSTNPPVP